MRQNTKKQQINHLGNNFISIPTPQKAGQVKVIDINTVTAAGAGDASALELIRNIVLDKQIPRETTHYMPGLDGLRALAVLAVIAYHFNLKWASGGLLGVSLFFVLSGYLITDQLISQWSMTGHINLKDFWLRRARRLLPALFTVLAGVLIWTAVVNPMRISSLLPDELAAVFYVSNWWLIFHHVSYFLSFGPPSPLGHLWSLAVEEQFYLFWPLLVWLCLSFVPSRKRVGVLILAGAAISAFAMAMIYQPGADPSRVYYGTDTRAFALLIGAALACMVPSRKLSAAVSSRACCFLDVFGGMGLLVVLLMILYTNEYETFLYQGGLLLFSLASALVVMVLAHPASRLGKLFGSQPLRWLGVRSYSIYLWHYPVIILTNPSVNTGEPDIRLILGQLTASIAMAALSYKLIEEPLRRGLWKRWSHLHRTKDQNDLGTEKPKLRSKEQQRISLGGWITSKGAFLILGLSCLSIIIIILTVSKAEPASTALPGIQTKAQDPSNLEPGLNTQSNGTDLENKDFDFSTAASSASSSSSSVPASANAPEKPLKTMPTTEAGKGITIIGDSVMLGAEPTLEKLLPGIVVDAQVGRQMKQAIDLIEQLKAQGKLGDQVVIELGSNGPFTYDQLTKVLESLGQVKQIILVNTRVPRSWEDVVNETLTKAAADYPRTHLIDWYSASKGHNEYFYKDGIHLNQKGMQAYTALIEKAVNPQ